MKFGRTYNFSADPAMMPEPVLEEIAAEMMNYRGSGMCVMEMSCRSLMNVPFVTPGPEQDTAVVAASKAAGFDNLKGHKSMGGLRASICNAMPREGVEALVEFLKKYEAEHA